MAVALVFVSVFAVFVVVGAVLRALGSGLRVTGWLARGLDRKGRLRGRRARRE